MNPHPTPSEAIASLPEVAQVAERLLDRIRSELLDLDAAFGVDSDLFHAGLDSMAIMQVILIVEEEFGAKLPDGSIKREVFATVRRIAEAVIEQRMAS